MTLAKPARPNDGQRVANCSDAGVKLLRGVWPGRRDPRAPQRGGGDGNVAAVSFDDPVHDSQAEAEAARLVPTLGLQAKKWRQHLLAHGLGDARAIIVYGDTHLP